MRVIALLTLGLCASAACSLTTSLDGFSGGASDAFDASDVGEGLDAPRDAPGAQDSATEAATDAGPITLVQAISAGDLSSTSRNVTAVKVTAGNLLLAAVGWQSMIATVTVDDNTGNTWQSAPAQVNQGTELQWWYATAQKSGDVTITVKQLGSGSNLGIYLLEYSGARAFDTAGGAIATSASNNFSTGPFTTSTDGDLIVAFFGDGVGLGSLVPGAGFTTVKNDTNWYSLVADNAPYATPAGSHVATATSPNKDNAWAATVIAFRR